MSVTCKQWILVACLSVVLGACSSSDGVSPNREGDGTTAGVSGTGVTDGTTAGSGNTSVGTTDGGADVSGAEPVEILQGRWTTGCLEFGTIFRIQTLNIIGDRMRYDLAAYSDQECTEATSIGLGVSGSTVQQNATTVPTGETRTTPQGDAVEVDFYFEEATIDNMPIPSGSFFGREDFEARVDYDIVYVENNVLFLGDIENDANDGTSAATRPIALNSIIQYRSAP